MPFRIAWPGPCPAPRTAHSVLARDTWLSACPAPRIVLMMPARDTWPSACSDPRTAPMVLVRGPPLGAPWSPQDQADGANQKKLRHTMSRTPEPFSELHARGLCGLIGHCTPEGLCTCPQLTLSTCSRQLRNQNHGGREYNLEQRH